MLLEPAVTVLGHSLLTDTPRTRKLRIFGVCN
jgi:hypothetical protein